MMTDDKRLKFEIMMTDSPIFIWVELQEKKYLLSVKLYDEKGEPNNSMVAAYVGLGGAVNVDT